MIRRGSAKAHARAVGLEVRAGRPRVKHFADIDSAGDEMVAGSYDIRDDKVQALR